MEKKLLSAILTVLIAITVILILPKKTSDLGSVVVGNEYRSTFFYGDSVKAQVLKASPGVLGSVIITGAASGNLYLYQATTTDATKRGNIATTSLPVITQFPASTAAGTYVYDIDFKTGLMAVWTGNVATSTITYR